jgi:hypothetical protein
MSPARPSGQLDQISEAIGELKGSVKSIEAYVHEGRHGVNNLSQKLDALGTRITRDIAAVEERMKIRFEAVEMRVLALETAKFRQDGAKGLVVWFLQSPLVGWIAATALFFAAWWKGQR